MSGFQAEKTGSGEFIVRHVLPESPAAGAGLRENDRITEINGLPAGRVSVDDLQKASLKEGELLQLVVQRGYVPITVALKLRRLI